MTGTWTKFRETWMVRVEGEVVVDGDFLTFTVVKKDGSATEITTMNEPEWTKDGVAIYCPTTSLKSSNVAARNARANARAEGAVVRNGFAYHI